MSDLEALMRQAQDIVRNMDPATKKALQNSLRNNQAWQQNPEVLANLVNRTDPALLRKIEARSGSKVNSTELKALGPERLKRMAKSVKAKLHK